MVNRNGNNLVRSSPLRHNPHCPIIRTIVCLLLCFILHHSTVGASSSPVADDLRLQFLHDMAMSTIERSTLFVGSAKVISAPSTTSALRLASTNAAVIASQISDASTWVQYPPVISIVLENCTWTTARDVVVAFIPVVDNHRDPFGWEATVSSVTTPLDTSLAGAFITYRFNSTLTTLNSNGKDALNLTLPLTPCFQPKLDDTITLLFSNSSTSTGHTVGDVSASSPVVFTLLAGLSQAASDGGRIIVTTATTAAGITFVLGNWFEALLILMQLQTIVIISQTTCAPRATSNIFSSSRYVVWPMQVPFGTAVGSDEQQLLGRLLFAFILAAVTICVQVASLGFFGIFGKKGGVEPYSRIKFPAGSLFVAGFLGQGALYISSRIFSLHYQGMLLTSPSVALTMSVIAFLSIVILLVVTWIAVFRLVSKQIFQPPSYKSLVLHFLLGGRWEVTDTLKQWGVVYEGVNGRNFWYFASYQTLSCFLVAFAAFLPGNSSMCSTQYFVMLAVQLLSTVIVFLRQPFKSAALNVLNIAISLLTTLVIASFITSSQCSSAGYVFAQVASWAAMTAIVLKAIVALAMQSTKRMLGYKEAAAKQRRMILIGGADDANEELSLHHQGQQHIGDGGVAKRRDAVSSAASIVYSLTDDDVNALQGAGNDFSGRNGALYKPRIPHPVVIGSCIAFREVGFGGNGGLRTVEGPSVALRLVNPCGICCDGEYIYIADKGNHRILRHSPALQRTTTLIGGNGPGYSGEDRYLRSVVKLNAPMFVALGQRCLYISDVDNSCVRCFDFASSQIHTVVGGISAPHTTHLSFPMGLCVVGNLLYICDSGNHRVVCFDAEENSARVVAGTKFPGFDANNTIATAARLNNPQSVCVRRGNGVLYVADTGNFRVVSIDPATRRLSIVMGLSGIARDTETHGRSIPAAEVALVLPTDVACGPSKSLLVVDAGASKIWHINQFGLAHVLVGPNEVFMPRCIAISKQSMEGHDVMYGVGDHSGNASTPAARPLGTLGPSGSLLQSAVTRNPSEHLLFHVSDYINSVVATVDASTSTEKVEFSPRRLRLMENPFDDRSPVNSPRSDRRGRTAAGADDDDILTSSVWQQQQADSFLPPSQLLGSSSGQYSPGLPMQQEEEASDPFILALRPRMQSAASSPSPPDKTQQASSPDQLLDIVPNWRQKFKRQIETSRGVSAVRDRSGRTIGVDLDSTSPSSPFQKLSPPTATRSLRSAEGGLQSLATATTHAENEDVMSNLLSPRSRQNYADQLLHSAASKPIIPGLNPLPAEHEAVRLHAEEGDTRMSSLDYVPVHAIGANSSQSGSRGTAGLRVVALRDTVAKGMSDAIDLISKIGRSNATPLAGHAPPAETAVLSYPNPHGRVAREMQIFSPAGSRYSPRDEGAQSSHRPTSSSFDLPNESEKQNSRDTGDAILDRFVTNTTAASTTAMVFGTQRNVRRTIDMRDEMDSDDDDL